MSAYDNESLSPHAAQRMKRLLMPNARLTGAVFRRPAQHLVRRYFIDEV